MRDLLHFAYAQRFSLRYWVEKRSSRTFAQAGEDLLIEKLLGQVRFFVDIGANDGITYSNTFYFALRGARGICFEPTRKAFRKLSALYRFNARVACIKCGISDCNSSAEIISAGGLSYLPDSEDERHSSIHAEALAKHASKEQIVLKTFSTAVVSAPKTIDLLSIDVEGHELNVLRTIPFDRYFFRAIVIETHVRNEWVHRDIQDINSLLEIAGYHEFSTTWVNTIYTPTHSIGVG